MTTVITFLTTRSELATAESLSTRVTIRVVVMIVGLKNMNMAQRNRLYKTLLILSWIAFLTFIVWREKQHDDEIRCAHVRNTFYIYPEKIDTAR